MRVKKSLIVFFEITNGLFLCIIYLKALRVETFFFKFVLIDIVLFGALPHPTDHLHLKYLEIIIYSSLKQTHIYRYSMQRDKNQINASQNLLLSQSKQFEIVQSPPDPLHIPDIMNQPLPIRGPIPKATQQESQLRIELTLNGTMKGPIVNPKDWKQGDRIGFGSSCSVVKAINKITGTVVAIKKISNISEQDGKIKKQLNLLAEFDHPNIVKYYGKHQFGNQTYVYLQYIQYDLLKFIKQFWPLPYNTFINFAKQLLQGLHYVHFESPSKVVHRDIKTSNVLVTPKGVLKLTDFGSAHTFNMTLTQVKSLGKSGTGNGTMEYFAPEVAIDNQFSRKSDIWSLGCTLLEMATRQKPWHKHTEQIGSNNFLQFFTQQFVKGTAVPYIPKTLHPDIQKLIDMCLKRNPQERASTKTLLELPFIKQYSLPSK